MDMMLKGFEMVFTPSALGLLLAGVVFGNIIGFLPGLGGVFALAILIPGPIVSSMVVLFCFLGYIMVMSKFPPAPLLVGVVLGKAAELNFHLSLQLFGNFFFLRPIAFFIFFLIVLGLALPPILARRREMFASDFCAALLAMKTARPVRIVYSRAEEFIASRQRHPMSYPTKKGEYHVTRGN